MINCKNCSECCGPVPVTYKELEGIKKAWEKIPKKRREQLKLQKRKPMTCILLDTKTNKCTVYESRPLVCKMFGHYKGLQCTYHPEEVLESDGKGRKRVVENGPPVGVLSMNIDYNRIES
ncbi:YkgJ family cysteine cluster protein [Bacillus cereus]|nr:YkgJ family cysteine cluster protein [Bacillus cereus]